MLGSGRGLWTALARRIAAHHTTHLQNKPFGPYACTGDAESLNKTWRAAMVSRDVLEHGERLSNLGWRMYHMRSHMVPVRTRGRTTAVLLHPLTSP